MVRDMSNKEKIIAKINHLVSVGFKVVRSTQWHYSLEEVTYKIDRISCKEVVYIDKPVHKQVGDLKIIDMQLTLIEYQDHLDVCKHIIDLYKKQEAEKIEREKEDVLSYLEFREENYLDKR